MRHKWGLRDEVVNEPGNGDGRQANPVPADDQEIRDLATDHGILLVPNGFLHAKSPDEHRKSRNDAKSERQTPDSAKVILAEDPEKDQRNERANHETEVNHRVCQMQGIVIRLTPHLQVLTY